MRILGAFFDDVIHVQDPFKLLIFANLGIESEFMIMCWIILVFFYIALDAYC